MGRAHCLSLAPWPSVSLAFRVHGACCVPGCRALLSGGHRSDSLARVVCGALSPLHSYETTTWLDNLSCPVGLRLSDLASISVPRSEERWNPCLGRTPQLLTAGRQTRWVAKALATPSLLSLSGTDPETTSRTESLQLPSGGSSDIAPEGALPLSPLGPRLPASSVTSAPRMTIICGPQ